MRQICLTERETEIFSLMCKGYSKKEIATELSIAVNTVGKHRENIHHKLGTHSVGDILKLVPVEVISHSHNKDGKSLVARLMRIERMLEQFVQHREQKQMNQGDCGISIKLEVRKKLKALAEAKGMTINALVTHLVEVELWKMEQARMVRFDAIHPESRRQDGL